MNKKLLVGSLAVVGGLALVAYLLKSNSPRRNSDGFFGASGGGMMSGGGSMTSRGSCRVCSKNGVSYSNWNGICDAGDKCKEKSASFQ
jgi:hypothetical protein